MPYRLIALLSVVALTGCNVTHEAPPDASDAGRVSADAGEDGDDGGPVDPRPCGGECVAGEDICDETLGACVECLSDADCGGEAPVCSESYCVPCAADDETCVEPDPEEPDPEEPDPEEPDPEEPDPEDPGPTDVRFASYNVRTSNLNNSAWGDSHLGFDANDAARMRRVADTIADQELTVVAAQEMRRPERDAVLTRLSNRHGQRWGHSTQHQGRDDTFILFRRSVWRLVRQVHFVIPLQAGLGDRYQIGALLQHKATGQRMWFYSVHFAAGPDAAGARATAARRTVASIRAQAVDRGQPFVLGGDFNALAGGPVGDILRAAGFMKDTRAVADRRVNNGCKTFNGLAGTAGRQQCPGGAAAHIDHVWVSRPRMDVRRYQVTANERTSRASDHNPVTVILRQR